MTLSLSPPVAGVWMSAYTWSSLWLSLLSTCSWCVVNAYTWLSLWLSLLSTCSWCVVRAYLYFILWQRKPLNCDKITKPSVGYCFILSRVYMYLNIHTTTVNVLGKINRIVYPKMKIMISVIHPLVVSTLNDCLSSVENRGGKWHFEKCLSFCVFLFVHSMKAKMGSMFFGSQCSLKYLLCIPQKKESNTGSVKHEAE